MSWRWHFVLLLASSGAGVALAFAGEEVAAVFAMVDVVIFAALATHAAEHGR